MTNFFQDPVTRKIGAGVTNVVGLRKDGSQFPVEIGLSAIETPHGTRVLAWIVDITERRQLEQQKERLLDVAFAVTGRDLDPSAEAGQAMTVRGPAQTSLGARSAAAFEGALQTFVRQIRLAVGAHQAAVSYLPDGDFSVAYHVHSFSQKYEKYNTYDATPTGEGIWKMALDSSEPICMTHEQLISHPLWKNFSGIKDARGLEHPPMRGWLAVPVMRGESGEAVGLIQLSDSCKGDFTQEDVAMASRFAQLIGPAFSLQYINERINRLVEERTADLARANEALACSNQDLEQFAYVASHDLQEPLRKVVSYCQLLEEEQAGKFSDEGREFLEVVVDGAKRLQVLVRDLLKFSRVRASDKPLDSIDANTSLQAALDNLELAISDRGAEVTTERLPRVLADQGQLALLFQNLIGNALKFCEKSPPKVHVGCRQVGEGCEFFVRDNGIGIDPNAQERIFQIFQRLHNREKYEGTGIGLAICKKIVERNGGQIRVESARGKGSTFYFTLQTCHHPAHTTQP